MAPRWEKLGQIYCPSETGRHPKLATHAANPLPVWLEGDVYRIFYSGRDVTNRSSVGAVDIDIVNRQIVREHFDPCFEYGPKGSFYADGVSIGCCYAAGGTRYMLFMGWQTPPDAHFRGDIGRLIVSDDLTLHLENSTPFMASNDTDPISLSYPWVEGDERNGYTMWYGTTSTWDAGNGEMIHSISHATSEDGQHWHRRGPSVPYELGRAQAFSRPTVAHDGSGGLDMWFSCRGPNEKYWIGRATSSDGRQWKLALEDVGIAPSAEGWDSEMIEYPYVFDHKGHRYMLYCGNGYGRTGFGLAEWQERPIERT